MSEELEKLRRLHEVATGRTVQLAAVIEQAHMWNVIAPDLMVIRYPELAAILNQADTDAVLREVRAKAWDEALATIDEKWGERFSELTPNPYREAQ